MTDVRNRSTEYVITDEDRRKFAEDGFVHLTGC